MGTAVLARISESPGTGEIPGLSITLWRPLRERLLVAGGIRAPIPVDFNNRRMPWCEHRYFAATPHADTFATPYSGTAYVQSRGRR